MAEHGPSQLRLVAGDLGGFIAHVSWRPGEGWRVYVTSWEPWETPTQGHQDTYTRLTADEAIDVLCAEQALRCTWLRDGPNGGGAGAA